MIARYFTCAVLIACVVATTASAEFGKPIGISNLPNSIRQSADGAAPGTDWNLAIEFSDGYKLFGLNSTNQRIFLRIARQGRVMDVEIPVSFSDVPQIVAQAMKSQRPDFKPSSVDQVGLETSTPLCYKFTDASKEHVFVTADGILVPSFSLSFIRLSDVPAAVYQAANDLLSSVQWIFAGKDSEENYVLLAKTADGRRIQFLFVATRGNQRLLRLDTPTEHVPSVVREALRNDQPRITVYLWEACGVNTAKITVYRAEGRSVEGKKQAFYVSLDGKKITQD